VVLEEPGAVGGGLSAQPGGGEAERAGAVDRGVLPELADTFEVADVHGVHEHGLTEPRQSPDGRLPPPMVNRNFTAARPNALWTTDLTYVPTRSGMA
jgi:hypothetical protein